MAVSKPKTTKTAAASKTTAKPAAKPKTTRATKTPAKKTTTRKAAPKKTKPAAVSAEERYNMVAEAAYYIAEKHGFTGDSSIHWAEAEAQIAAVLDK